MSNRQKKTLKGFSLGEVLLSIVVLLAGLLPILAAMSGALRTTLDSEDMITASGLAQEGAELIVNVKDNGVLSTGDAFSAFPRNGGGALQSADTCRISLADTTTLGSPSTTNTIPCAGGANYYGLTTDVGGGDVFYKHRNTVGKFNRRIYLIYTNPGYRVGSVVYWGTTAPGNANNIAQFDSNVRNFCTTVNKCVMTDVELTPWK